MKTGKTSGAKKPKMAAGNENFTEKETTLFDLLKELRREIAREEKSPALHRILRQDAGTYVPCKTQK